FHGQLDGVAGLLAALVPLDVDATFWIVEEVHDIRTGRGMHRDALSTCDVSDDLLAADRIATTRAEHEQIVEATNFDFFLTSAHHPLERGRHEAFRRLLSQAIGRNKLDEYLLRRHLAVANGSVEIFSLWGAELGQGLRERLALDQILGIQV